MVVLLLLTLGVWLLDPCVADAFPSTVSTRLLTKIRCDQGMVLITDAYFNHQQDSFWSVNCKPEPRCSPYPGCHPRFNLTTLNTIYNALGSEREKLSKLERDLKRDRPCLQYVCVDSMLQAIQRVSCVTYLRTNENAPFVVNPCRYEKERKENQKNTNFTYIIVPPVDPHNLSSPRACRKLCYMQNLGLGAHKVEVRFVPQDAAIEDSSYLEYWYNNAAGSPVKRGWINSSNHRSEDDGFVFNITEIQLRFNIEDLSAITRLWVSLQGANFSLTCGDRGDPVLLQNITEHPDDSSAEGSEMAVPLTAGITAFIAILTGIVIFLYWIRTRHAEDELQSQQETQVSSVPPVPTSQYDEIALRDDLQAGSARDQQSRSVGNQNKPGREDNGQYTRLARDGRHDDKTTGAVDSNHVYDHTASQNAASPQHAASLQGADGAYDQLRHQPTRVVVVDNVYDSSG